MTPVTPVKLLKLVTANPLKFLHAFAAGAFNETQGIKEDQPLNDFLSDKHGNHVNYIENYLMNKQFMGLHLEQEHAVGGGEGGGEDVERVWSVRLDGKTQDRSHCVSGGNIVANLRVTGFYQSYDGVHFNDFAEIVFPAEVMVTQYFTKPALKRHLKALHEAACNKVPDTNI